MTSDENAPDDTEEHQDQGPVDLNPDIQSSLRASFEARDYTVEFHPRFMYLKKGDRIKKVLNSDIMKYIDAFS